ncbi:hypothetical protein [Mycobacterium sp. E1747]|uniref:DUF7065 domain-containing protein n=1 Tax=Mycobacterium sp. E1747 TaxID=1834128 RepID=UPI0007FC6014|nr:hypothetical protein [Mycobacterium sp. E1747]OBH11059.1 hypothetical protein A5695_20720 [Mycobacterium sp. E1747]
MAAHPYVRGPHDPGASEFFQESVFLCWADHERGYGGLQRIGQEVNRGLTNQWTAVYGPGGVAFRSLDSFVPLEEGWRTDESFQVHDKSKYYFAGDSGWEIRTPEFQADYQLHDLYPFTPFYAVGNDTSSDWATEAKEADEFVPRHWEAASRITGTLTLLGTEVNIDGYAVRDHSFGFRDWSMIRNHRAMVGTFGPQLSFSCLVWHTSDDAYSAYGYINRNGVEEWTDDATITVEVLPDGITLPHGRCEMRFPSGETVSIESHTRGAFLMPHREYIAVDHLCEITCGQLSGGYADLEASINPFDGRRYPTFSLGTVIADGITR